MTRWDHEGTKSATNGYRWISVVSGFSRTWSGGTGLQPCLPAVL